MLKPTFTTPEIRKEEAWKEYIRERERKQGRGVTAASQLGRGVFKGLYATPLQEIGKVGWHLWPSYYKKRGIMSPLETSTYRAGSWIEKAATELFPANPEYQKEFLTSVVPSGIGSFGAMAAQTWLFSPVTKGLGIVAGGVPGRVSGFAARKAASYAIPAAIGGMQVSGEIYQDALAHGASESTAFKASLLGYPLGFTNAIPFVENLNRLNKISGNTFGKLLANLAVTSTVGGLGETFQEGGEQVGINLTAKALYDESRKWYEGVATGALAGGVIGFLFTGIGGGISTRLKTASPADRVLLQKAQENFEKAQAVNEQMTSESVGVMQSQHTANMREMFASLADQDQRFGNALNNPSPGMKLANHLDPKSTPDAISRIARMNLVIQAAAAKDPSVLTEVSDILQKKARKEKVDIKSYSLPAQSAYDAIWTKPYNELKSRYGANVAQQALTSELLLSASLHGNDHARRKTKNWLIKKQRGKLLRQRNKVATFDEYYNDVFLAPDIIKNASYDIADAVANPEAMQRLWDAWDLQGGEGYADRMLQATESQLTDRVTALKAQETRTKAQETELTKARQRLQNVQRARKQPFEIQPEKPIAEADMERPPEETRAEIPPEKKIVTEEQRYAQELAKAEEEASLRREFIEKEGQIERPVEKGMELLEGERQLREKRAQAQNVPAPPKREYQPPQEMQPLPSLTEEQIRERETEMIIKINQEADARRIAQELAKEQAPFVTPKAAIIDGRNYPIYELKGPKGSEYYIKTPTSKQWYPITEQVNANPYANRIVIEDISFAQRQGAETPLYPDMYPPEVEVPPTAPKPPEQVAPGEPPVEPPIVTKTPTEVVEAKPEAEAVTPTVPERSTTPPERLETEVVEKPEALLTSVTTAETTAPSNIAKVAVSDLTLAPERFQYKIGHGKAGVTGTLKEAKQFREELAGVVNVWRDPADGKTYVVNGHNRVELAQRSGVDAINVKYLDAATAEEARTWGALINIAEGRGTVLDAAKLFRDSGISKDDLIQYGIALTERNAREGVALSALNETLFRATARGEFPLNYAVAIGSELSDHTLQLDIVRLIEKETKKGKRIDVETIRELADMAKGAPTAEVTEMTLFGPEVLKQTYTLEKSELQAYIRQRLGKEKKLFGVVSKSANAQELAKAGNVIDIQANENISTEAAQLLSIFDTIKKTKGEINDILNDAAEKIGKGGNANAIKQETYETIRERLPEIIGRGEAPAAKTVAPSPAEQLEIIPDRPEVPAEGIEKGVKVTTPPKANIEVIDGYTITPVEEGYLVTTPDGQLLSKGGRIYKTRTEAIEGIDIVKEALGEEKPLREAGEAVAKEPAAEVVDGYTIKSTEAGLEVTPPDGKTFVQKFPTREAAIEVIQDDKARTERLLSTIVPQPIVTKEIPREAQEYINRIRNKPKKQYAQEYANWLVSDRTMPEPARPKELGVMGEQAVRLQLDKLMPETIDQTADRVATELSDAIPDQTAKPTPQQAKRADTALTKNEIMDAVQRLPKTGQAYWTAKKPEAKIIRKGGLHKLTYKGKQLAEAPIPADLVVQSDFLINRELGNMNAVPDNSDVEALIYRYRKANNVPDFRNLGDEYDFVTSGELSPKDQRLLEEAVNLTSDRVYKTPIEDEPEPTAEELSNVLGDDVSPEGITDEVKRVASQFKRDESGFLRFRRDRIPDDVSPFVLAQLVDEKTGDLKIPDDVPKEISQTWREVRSAYMADEELLKSVAGEEGEAVIAALKNVRDVSQINRAEMDGGIRKAVEPLSRLEKVTGRRLAPPSHEKLLSAQMAVEGALIPLDEQQQALVDEYRRVMNEAADWAEANDMTVRTMRPTIGKAIKSKSVPFAQARIKNYWPHVRNFDSQEAWQAFVKEQHDLNIESVIEDTVDKLIGDARRAGKTLTEADVLEKATKKAHAEWTIKDTERDLRMRKRFGGGRPMRNLEYARTSRQPGYRRDWDVPLEYIEDFAWRKAEIEFFGKDDEKMKDLIDAVGEKHGGNAKMYAQEVFDRFIGRDAKYESQAWYFLNRVTGTWNVLSFMGLSTVNQMAQWWNAPFKAGYINSLRATFGKKGVFTAQGREFAREAASTLAFSLDTGLLDTKIATKFLKLNVFLQMDKGWRKISAIAGAMDAEQHANRMINGKEVAASRRYLEQLGLNPDEIANRGYMTDLEKKLAAKRTADFTQFSGASYEVPPWMKRQKSKFLVMNLRQFAYMQSRMMAKITTNMISEVRMGNFRPMMRFFTGIIGQAATGELIRAVKAAIYGTWDETEWTIDAIRDGDWVQMIKNLGENVIQASTFGIAADVALTLWKWGPGGLFLSAPGPGPGQIADMVFGVIWHLAHGRPKAAGRTVLSNFIGGNIWAQHLKEKKKKGYRL